MLFQKQTERVVNTVVSLPTSLIRPNPDQPRAYFDNYALTQLAVSIRQNGIMQPLIVRKAEDGYILIAGERRLRAAKLVNLDYVPCIVREAQDKDSAVMAILENIQRADLNYLEEAVAIKRLIDSYGLTQEEAAVKLGIAQSTVANKLRLLRLRAEDRAMLVKYGLTERQARALLRLPEEMREEAIQEMYLKQMNSAQAEHYVELLCQRFQDKPKQKIIDKSDPKNMVGLYLNTFSRTVEEMKSAGISCETEKISSDEEIEYRIKIKMK